jgi:UDP-N-acetylglucosamine--N-acetylmuramyl-(pentapeptide) pyrophosphoryl-undecaprenol N-acetylglucosamine transferase
MKAVKPPSPRVYAVVAGGGTGGHVYPALAVADELVRRGHPADSLRFLGSARGLEAEAVPAAGYTIELLPGRGWRRSLAPDALAQNARTAVDTLVAVWRAIGLLRRWRPRVVFGVGGYAAAPAMLAARMWGIPVVVHEQNAAPGVVNRLAVALGARAAVSLPGTELRGARVTGNPVRAEIAALGSDDGSARAGRPGPARRIGVFGGSLGAGRINDATLGLAQRWRDRADVSIRHVAGRRDYQRCVDTRTRVRRPDDRLTYELVEYEDDMPSLYRSSDVVVTRAGAVTVAELALSGTPAVLVPLPGAPSDHQSANAAAMVRAGAAVALRDAECEPERLGRELDALLAAPERLAAMRAAARMLAVPDAAARVADLVEESAGAA